jgi:hypothetical protein
MLSGSTKGAKAYMLRNVADPDEIVAFGFFHDDGPELLALRDEPETQRKQAKRAAAMAPHVEETVVDGSYEVLEAVTREDARSPLASLAGGVARPDPGRRGVARRRGRAPSSCLPSRR